MTATIVISTVQEQALALAHPTLHCASSMLSIRGGPSWPRLYASWALLTAAAITWPIARASAQSPDEVRVRDSLRAALALPAGDSILISRSYSELFFPGAVFYRATYLPRTTWHATEKRAAAVIVDSQMFMVRSTSDLPEVWRAAVAPVPLGAFEVRMACSELLLHTGSLDRGARFIVDVAEIPARRRALLQPASDLLQVAPAVTVHDRSGIGEAFYVWDGTLYRATCTAAGRNLNVRLHAVAREPANEP